MQSKKRIIIISVIVIALVGVILLSSMLFSLKTVSVECLSTSTLITEQDYDDIISAGNFNYGKNILFMNLDDEKNNIEKAFPYVCVVNLERKFPSYIVVNIKERVPAIRYKDGEYTYVLDSDLKVLNAVNNDLDYNNVTKEQYVPEIVINTNKLRISNLVKSEFAVNDFIKMVATSFYNGAVIASQDDSAPINNLDKFEKITISYDEALSAYKFDITFSGSDIVATVYNNTDLTDRVYKLLNVYLYQSSGVKSFYYGLNASDIVAQK